MRRWMLVPVVVALLALTACAPEAPPETEPSVEPSSSQPAEPSEPAAEPLELPDCDDIYTPAMVETLISESRVRDADGTVSRGSLDDGISAIFDELDETVTCGWYLPASESGSTTTIAVIDTAARTELDAAFTAGGFSAATTVDGELYSIRVEEEFITYEESHLLFDGVWIGTLYVGGSAEPLTINAYAQSFQ